MYDYREAMAQDIRAYVVENGIDVTTENRQEIEEELSETLWLEDSVTGNASGSYTFNRWTAQEYVVDNIDLLGEACKEFGLDDSTVGDKFLSEDWEYFDVTIRCYLLYSVLNEVLGNLERDPDEESGTDLQ